MSRTTLTVLLATLLVSCSATYDEKIAGVHAAFYAGDLEAANRLVEELVAGSSGDDPDHTCLLLDAAIVRLASGNADRAESDLRRVRDELDRLEDEDVVALLGDITSYFGDDRSRVYRGEDHEKILLRVMLAFSNMLRGGEDVTAYANQVLQKQRQILDEQAPDRSGDRYKKDYPMIGAGAYVYGVVTEERDPTAGSEALISYRRVKEWEPQFAAIDGELARAEEGRYAGEGNGVLYVFGFAGRGPMKIESERGDVALVSELAAQVTRFIPEVQKYYGASIDLSPIRVPELIANPTNRVVGFEIGVDGERAADTDVLTDVTATALKQYDTIRDWVLARAVIRRMVKKAVVTAVKGTGRMLVERNSGDRGMRDLSAVLLEIGGIVANTAWSATERADTRHWSLLPDTIQALRLELPEGEHEISVTPLLSGAGRGAARAVRVEIVRGQNTYLLAFVPTPGPGPDLLTTRPAFTPAPASAAAPPRRLSAPGGGSCVVDSPGRGCSRGETPPSASS